MFTETVKLTQLKNFEKLKEHILSNHENTNKLQKMQQEEEAKLQQAGQLLDQGFPKSFFNGWVTLGTKDIGQEANSFLQKSKKKNCSTQIALNWIKVDL